ncbi:MAG: PBP1A family penicillin-binding protein [Anaerolineae bacterium]|nr:PBP1A family penicillin-binding protein [Anaerolineae bacterium]
MASRPTRTPVSQRSGYAPPSHTPQRLPDRPPRPLPAWMAQLFFIFSLLVSAGFGALVLIGIAGYLWIVRDLPDPAALEARQSTFASTQLFDREGNLLVELTDPSSPTAGRRTYVPLSQISPWVIKATLATEDPNFYRYNVGFDPIAIVRAIYYAFTERAFVSGGSTIAQQVARNLLLSPEERASRSPWRKLREIALANELVRRYPRDKILEIYLNENNYANLAYGIEAAAQTYFDKPARDLTLAEASLLAGIPQAPALWDPVARREQALRRQRVVLDLMVEQGMITLAEAEAAHAAMRAREFRPPPANFTSFAPHFVQFVRQQLDAEYGAQALYRQGLRVHTTLDPRLQRIAERAVREQLAKLKERNVTNAAVVMMRPSTGEILAMVGSADFNDLAIDGQVNVALARRQPGSAIKPFVYLAAFERGWTPATLLWDQPKTFTDAYGKPYAPRNYDGKFNGPVLVREALARSLNVPAVETLNFVGVPEFLELANRVGLNLPPNPYYGLAVALGSAEVRLLDLTAAYAVLANNGVRVPPTALLRVERADGTLVRDYRTPQGQQVVLPEHAYLITHILSDNAARARTFGTNSPLRLSRPAAAKTGTTNDFRDNLTVGYTPDLVVGVWVGNSDNSPMRGVSGITGAAPIWKQIMEEALADTPPRDFAPPPGVVRMEVCALGGRMPSPSCPPEQRRQEVFKADQPPLPPDEAVELAVAARDPSLIHAPKPTDAPPQTPEILITQPAFTNPAMRGVISVRGTVNPPGFQHYVVEYGFGDNPAEWHWISGPHLAPVVNEQLTEWNAGALPPGRYTLRVTAYTTSGVLVGYSHFDLMP